MKKNDDLPSLESLQEKIDEVKALTPTRTESSQKADLSQAMRISVDLVAGVGVGIIAGYFLDDWLGSKPLFMMVGLGLGMVAGIKNMMLNAEMLDKKINTKHNEENKDI